MSKNDIVVEFENEKDIDVKFDKPYQKYNAGYGIIISNKTISVDDEVIASKEYVNEEIGKLDFYDKEEVDSKLAEKQDTIIAGQDIVKNGNTISVDRTYIDTQIASVKDYTNKMIAKVVYGDIPTNQVDYFGYQNQVPQGIMPYASLLKIGGMSYKINQLVQNGNFVDTSNWGYNGASNRSVNNNITTLTSNGSSSMQLYQQIPTIVGHKYLISGGFKPSVNATMIIRLGGDISGGVSCNANQWTTITRIATASATTSEFNFYHTAGQFSNGDTCDYRKGMVFDLTAMGIDTTDVSVATSELLKRGIDINEYQAYDSGSIRDSAVSSVVSKDSNDTTLDTLTIDSNIQALTGYGWGINDTCYNYIDFENKKFVQKVGRVDLGTLNYTVYNADRRVYRGATIDNLKSDVPATSIPNLLCVKYTATSQSATWVNGNIAIRGSLDIGAVYICDTDYATAEAFKTAMSGVYLYYELATPIETDISEYIDNNFIEVEPNGSLITENEYKQYVPSSILYIEEEE